MNDIYTTHGCNRKDVVFLSIFPTSDTHSDLDQYIIDHAPVEYPIIYGSENNGDDNGGSVFDYYAFPGNPAGCLIAPNRDVVEQDLYPNGGVMGVFSGYGIGQYACKIQCDFQGVPTTVTYGQTVNFTDLSTEYPAVSWEWAFQNGQTTSSNVQNPNIQYTVLGTHDVQLIVFDGLKYDTMLKADYIEVIEPAELLAVFTSNTQEIIAGQSVDFTDLSLGGSGPPDSWSWDFSGSTTPTSNTQNPTGVQYNNPGYYTVSLTVSNNAGETDDEVKVNYIHVIDPDSLPKADFQASQTTILPGTTIDYANLSTFSNMIDSSQWVLESADAPNNNITVMLNGDLPTVAYNTAPGLYDATLIIYYPLGSDTMRKDDYIYVVDPNDLDTVYANFAATTPRLIQQGWTVEFTDLSVGPVTNWHWEFEGGTPSSFDGQYPPAITYNSTDGPFDVTLEVSNANYADTAYKPEYIVVITQWPWPDEEGFCEDDLTNMQTGEQIAPARHLISNPEEWGYFPGHNYLKVKYYAEKFTNYTFDKIREVHIAPSRIQNNSQNYNKVKYYVWDVDSVTGMPGEVLGYKTTYISDYTQQQYYNVVFDEPIEVSEEFYVGFYLYYPSASSGEPQDTFATYFSGNRPNGPNTTVCAKSTNNWLTPTQMLGDTLEMSLDLRLKACIIKVKEIDYSEEVNLYPNPTTGKVTIELGDIPVINPTVDVFDLTGRKIYTNCVHTYGNTYELDLRGNETGFYIINMNFGDAQVTKKITLIN